MKITCIGHSTVLIEAAGKRILTDPFFSPHGNIAYKRIAPPLRKREDVGKLDLVVVSHHHWDHTDRLFFRSLADDVPVVTGKASTWMIRLRGAKNIVGLANWEMKQFDAIRITAVPASHLAVAPRGYIIEVEGKTVYFAGDTYYRDFMREIGKRYSVDLALLPVATFRTPTTMGEHGALRAVESLSPKTVIPIHLGLTPRSPLLRKRETPEGFAKRVQDAGLRTDVRILRDGQIWET